MGLSLAQMREHVYTFYEVDTDDISHALIDNWAAEGFRKAAYFRPNWPFYEMLGTHTTLAGVQTFEDSDVGSPRSVESVIGPDGPLSVVSMRDGILNFRHSDGTFPSGKPRYYARRGGTWYLYPTPDAAYEIQVLGYREPVQFGAQAGSEPDLPDELHDAVLQWVKYRVYLHQDDTELAEIEKFTFEEALTMYGEDITATDADYPTIVGGGPFKKGLRTLGPPRPPSDWD